MSSFIKGVCIAGILLIPGVNQAQLSSAAIAGGPVITPFNTPAANVPVRVCLLVATGTPCSTAGVTLYSDYALTHPIANPTSTNALGTYTAFVPTPGTYLVQIQVTPTTTYSYPITAQSGNISGSLTAGRLILASGVNTIANSLADYGLTTSGHFTFPAPVDTQGGTLTGPLVGQKNTFKLPRIDATHPDFSSGCSGAYTACAINNALAYRASQCAAISISPQQCPPVYLSEGTYTLEATIKWPLNTTLIGDGTQSTTLLLPSNSTYPAITSEAADVTNTTTPLFGQIRDLTIAAKDHTASGIGIDLSIGGAVFISHVDFFNLDLGFNSQETAEKTICDTCNFINDKQAGIVFADNIHFPNTSVFLPGKNTDGYEWNVNCPNGVCPASGAIAPENRHAAFYTWGSTDNFEGTACKPLALEPCFKVWWAEGTVVQDFYFEGASFGHVPWGNSVNSSILHPGAPDSGDGSGTVANCTAGAQTYPCVASSNAATPWADWWPVVVGDPANIHAARMDDPTVYRGKAYIFCQDYAPGSTSACASNPGVQQGQWEIAYVVLSQGKWYLTGRNLSGSTAPSNTAWVNPHFEFPATVGDTGGGFQVKSVHPNADLPTFNAGYSANCTDATLQECAEMKAGPIDDPYISYLHGPWSTANPTNPGTNINSVFGISFSNAPFLTIGSQATGQGWMSVDAHGGYNIVGGSAAGTGQANAGVTGNTFTSSFNPFSVKVNGWGTSCNTQGCWANPSLNGGEPLFTTQYQGSSPSFLGNNPNWTLGSGSQFYNSSCTAGVATSGGSNFRSCLIDSNNSGGAGMNLQMTSNGNAAVPTWTSVFTVSASGLNGSWVSPQFSPIPVNAFSFTAVASGSTANCTAYSSVALSAGRPTFTFPSSVTLPGDGGHNGGAVVCYDINGSILFYTVSNTGGTAQTASIAGVASFKFNPSSGLTISGGTNTLLRCVGGTLDGQVVWKASACTGSGGTTTSTMVVTP